MTYTILNQPNVTLAEITSDGKIEITAESRPMGQLCDDCGGRIGETCTCRNYRAEVADLQARLIERTEQSTATAYRDAETIRRLRRVLRQIISDLPTRRDWLDPDLEKEARCLADGKEGA